MTAKFPHCDPRILHAPGTCEVCDLYPGEQALRKTWRMAFTGQKVESTAVINGPEPIFPCPADFIRGDNHTNWGGNRPFVSPAPESAAKPRQMTDEGHKVHITNKIVDLNNALTEARDTGLIVTIILKGANSSISSRPLVDKVLSIFRPIR